MPGDAGAPTLTLPPPPPPPPPPTRVRARDLSARPEPVASVDVGLVLVREVVPRQPGVRREALQRRVHVAAHHHLQIGERMTMPVPVPVPGSDVASEAVTSVPDELASCAMMTTTHHVFPRLTSPAAPGTGGAPGVL